MTEHNVLPGLSGMTIVFDLDGTLVDTAPDLIRTCNHVLASIDLPEAPREKLQQLIGYGSRAMIEAALSHHQKVLPEADVARLHQEYLAHYAATIADGSTAFPGVVDVIADFRRSGARLAVCTNKVEALSRQLLGELDLIRLFDGLAGRDTYDYCKPDPRHLTSAVTLAGGDPKRAIMIGDSEVDIATARAAGVPVVAVTFGYTPQPVATFRPDAIIDHYSELPAALQRLLEHPAQAVEAP